ncbi:BgTH12-01602 [Blumeria graminis f. sp. triticale]|uniref:Nucleolar protein 9 n=1 Tax=Blumeria graminis f. sp. triticale TaxID=1689686 RepID=A0A9W4GEZ2_BLUGR|nr:BgTH12-01602 [Blumeria graminis f. sp. triticale]
MPKKPHFGRGRRNLKELKRKRDDSRDSIRDASKRKRDNEGNETAADYIGIGIENEEDQVEIERPFYGMLEEEEQEYFRRADELLESNNFPDEEQRSLFLENVYREAENKELKIACSQSCSRLMERLIILSTIEQKKRLFVKFAASAVSEELVAISKSKDNIVDEELPSMETLLLQTLDELEGNIIPLITDRFASHTLRVLLIILDGRPLIETSTKSLVQSKRKEKVDVSHLSGISSSQLQSKRSVPSSFTYSVEKIVLDVIDNLDTSFVRVLSTHPTGNPTLQLLLELELTNPNLKKRLKTNEKTIMSFLLPDSLQEKDSESSILINGLLYDPIGSRLLETVCSFAPGNLFKKIYNLFFKQRIAAILRNEISSYTAIRVLSRIGKQDLEDAVEATIPQIPGLLERNRTATVKALVESCHVRGVDTRALINAISTTYGDHPETLLLKMTCMETTTLLSLTAPDGNDESKAQNNVQPKLSSAQLHGSLLAQSLLTCLGPPSELIQNSLLSLPPQILLALSLLTTTSHIIQSALSPSLPVSFRRKLINSLLFSTHIPDDEQAPIITLSLSSIGSHVVDALLVSTASPSDTANRGTTPLFSYAERISSILITQENTMRNSYSGRIVWRNWSLDVYKRARSDWVKKIKSITLPEPKDPPIGLTKMPGKGVDIIEDRPINITTKTKSFGINGFNEEFSGEKSAIERAREKFAISKIANDRYSQGVVAKHNL